MRKYETTIEKFNYGFAIGYIKMISKKEPDYFKSMIDKWLKEHRKEANFLAFAKCPIEVMIDKASGLDEKKRISFNKFVDFIYESMWEEKHNKFFDELENDK